MKGKMTGKKIVVIVLLVLAGLFLGCLCLGVSIETLEGVGILPTTTESPTKTVVPSTMTPEPTNTLEPSPTPTFSESIQDGVLGKITQIQFDYPAEKNIIVRFDIADLGTRNLIGRGAKLDVVEILHNIKDSGVEYNLVGISGSFTMKDAYGNVENSKILGLVFSKETINKIQWDNFDYNNIYDISDYSEVHPELIGD